MLPRIIFFAVIISSSSFAKGRFIRELRCDCGIANEDDKYLDADGLRVFAGQHAWPWMAAIVNVSIPNEPVAYCGATLINDRYIMTAQHCLPDMHDTGLKNFRIYLGSNDLLMKTLDLEILEVKSHPKFDFDSADYDIALIKLSQIVTFGRNIRPVCLKQEDKIVGRIGTITGWGSFNLTTNTEEMLKESQVEVVPNESCASNYSTVDIPVTNTMLCASLPGQDPCKGDSGGPLVLRDKNNRYNQIGIVSHGEGCAVQAFPAIFSRVSVFIDWIVENTRDGRYCRGSF